jgi:ribosomal protein L13E
MKKALYRDAVKIKSTVNKTPTKQGRGFSQEELKQAEFTPQEISQFKWFQLTSSALHDLKKEGVPQIILDRLHELVEQEFKEKEQLTVAIERCLEKEQNEKYKPLILQYATLFHLPVDKRRRSCHNENVKTLMELKKRLA